MSERPQPPRPADEFGLTEQEQLYDRVTHERLLGFLGDEAVSVHRVEESYNNYGEFLFVTLSKPTAERQFWVTFYGAGYHASREKWVTKEWFWYANNPLPEKLLQTLTREEVLALIEERLESIRPYVDQVNQTQRGKLFEVLADLTDEDAAYTELEDMEDLAGKLFDDLE